MNINYKAENKENKQLNLEKRNKQNSGIPKPALYTVLSIAGIATVGIIGKILYDRSKKSDDKLGSQQDNNVEDNYNPNVKITDKNYLIAFKQGMLEDSYCFHNVWLQLLACPDIRCKKYGLPNTDKAISWINSVIAKEKDTMTLMDRFNDGNYYRSKTIDVPKEIRLQPEIKFKNPLNNEEIDVTNYEDFDVKKGAVPEGKGGANFPYAVSAILNACYKKKINNIGDFMPFRVDLPVPGVFPLKVDGMNGRNLEFYQRYEDVPACLLDLGVIKISNTEWRYSGVEKLLLPQDVKNGNGPENFLAQIQLFKQYDNEAPKPPDEMHYFMNGFYGYKPTFGIVRMGGHYKSFYIIYDQNGNIKRILENSCDGFARYSNDANDNKCAGSINDFISNIFTQHSPCWFKYSNQDIVKKYYTE